MSDNGRVTFTLPKSVRDAHGYEAGTEFEVIEHDNVITLEPVKQEPKPAGKKLTIDEFLSVIPRYSGPPITDEMIDETILSEAKHRWDKVNRQWDEDKND
ncbi:AbrB/MazE/SpoVT family DNA-binding domain-containing protein [Rhizobium sp. CB3090]|uniref:AbrB/MazE/SpoVT family DNA-binding domain-containing protein n=1 Tax=Rhizobium sp. CB3090 TaxID=3039156 RepID=UPI0024B1A55F|nr:AbrB/MazE/SpoVT family DNA-binding domain-containing protein [Rhizobium sp. CB3090]WFU10978.1 AbrB/MazE/SpoVT family DNA-binding domain-containing protein [Rhizobium sp. CB3090]